MKKPLLIIVSGAPGAGKTKFASELATHMELLHIERDRVFESMQYTFKPKTFSRQKDGIPLFYKLITSVLKAQTSLVVDATLYKDKSEADLAPLLQHARMINVHCRAANEHRRFYEREIEKAGKIPDWLPELMPKLDDIYSLVRDPLNLGCPLIEVNTTDIYYPDIPTVALRINEMYKESSERLIA